MWSPHQSLGAGQLRPFSVSFAKCVDSGGGCDIVSACIQRYQGCKLTEVFGWVTPMTTWNEVEIINFSCRDTSQSATPYLFQPVLDYASEEGSS